MLVLSRKPNEEIVIDGRIHIKVIEIRGNQVRIGIDAPKDVVIHRQEVFEQINAEQDSPNGSVGSDQQLLKTH